MNAIPLYKKHNVSCSAITQYIFFFLKTSLKISKNVLSIQKICLSFFFQAELFKYSTISIYIMDDMILFVLVVLSYHSGLSVLTKVLQLLKHYD